MIARLAGLLDSVAEDSCVLDVAGVGYLVFCSAKTLAHLPRRGEPMKLLIETHVREDHIHLYGFAAAGEQHWFRLLQTVQGVGARLALNILSALSPDELTQIIAAGDKTALTRAPGVGGKLAVRLLTELKDKVGAMAAAAPAAITSVAEGSASSDAVSALVNLGYRRAEAFGAVAKAARELGAEASVQALIRSGLKELAQ